MTSTVESGTGRRTGNGAESGPRAPDAALARLAPRLAGLRAGLAVPAEAGRKEAPGAGEAPALTSGRSADRETREVRVAFTGGLLARLPCAGPADVEQAAARVRAAAAEWARRAPRDRARPLWRFHDLLLDRMDEVLDIVQLETGKARRHAFEELVDALLSVRWYAARASRLLAPRRRRGALPPLTRTRVYREPWGLVGLIVPWNYPLALTAGDVAPALLAGNGVLLKPDLQTTHTAALVADLLAEAGVPRDLVAVVPGEGPVAGAAVVDAADFVAFTGGTETGRAVARRAAGRLRVASLELGGKNSLIVLPGADLRRAVDGAVRGAFANAGQLCIGTERILVHRDVHDEFLARLAARVGALRLGATLDWSADVGSLTSAAQLARVRAHVEDAVARGAVVRAGGRARPEIGPWFFEPTLLTGVDLEADAFREETFGPVASVRPFATEDEAVELANHGRLGLNASIWSRDPRPARRIARRLQAGTVNVNEAYAAAWGSLAAPMGGMRDSGSGRRHGPEGLLRFAQSRTVAEQRLLPLDAAGPWVARPGLRRLAVLYLRASRRLPGLR
ncbi:MAG: succinic semialdehyde dehydrogenase [Gemmatimonadota bacterium]|nr:succinic semialdehyde dehydrogenase [Gemmatimonadota bacterium]